MASISYARISEFAKTIGLTRTSNGFAGFVTATADWGTLHQEKLSWTLSQEYDIGCYHVDIITPDNINNLERFYSAPGGIVV